MSALRVTLGPAVALLLGGAACDTPDAGAPPAGEGDVESVEESATLRAEFGSAGGLTVYGVAAAPPADTDQAPRFQLAVAASGEADRSLGILALDAIVDRETGQLAWIDPQHTLWAAPLSRAPAEKQNVADDVIHGLAASRGRLAFAVRVEGPETAPVVADLRTSELTPLSDGPGPDEVLGFSPDASEVLILSARTGLSSLFAAGVDAPSARQLTNVGLAPGPELDTSKVAPAPIDRRDVAWGPRGLAFRAEGAVMRLSSDGALERVGPAASSRSLSELVR